jgi:aryl-alcohol dehydrogenase-like predicted oxidoreductase
MQKAYDRLIHEGIHLQSNQVEYNLLNREIEFNGLLEQSHQLGVQVIAYSPLALGLLSGKYSPDRPFKGMRNRRFGQDDLRKVQPLIRLMGDVGAAHDGKTPAQVALNWIICKGAIPIPGAKNAAQVLQNLGALGWRLSEEEIKTLDAISEKIIAK